MAFFAKEEQCPHCPHPKHNGLCGVMTDYVSRRQDETTAMWQARGGGSKIGCQCRVEPPIPNSWVQGYIYTASGIKFNFSNPTPEMVELKDIAHHLAQKPRFSGACRYFHSLAMHSLIVAAAVDEIYRDPHLVIHALLHDCSEYILPDIPSPMKPRIPWWHSAEDKIEAAVAEKFGLDAKLFHDPRIKDIDWAVLNEEANVLIKGWEPENYDKPIKGLHASIVLCTNRNWENTRAQFIHTFTRLQKGMHV